MFDYDLLYGDLRAFCEKLPPDQALLVDRTWYQLSGLRAEAESLAAENARLKAEVERLTPKEMTLEACAGLFNRQHYLGASDWKKRGLSVISVSAGVGFQRIPALAAADMLRRMKGGGS